MENSIEPDVWELFDVSAGAEGSIDTYLNGVVERFGRWFSAEGVTLFLQIEGSDTFLLAAKFGIDADLPSTASFLRGESIAGSVAFTGEARLVDGPHNHPALDSSATAVVRNVESAIVAPLTTPQLGCIGVLNISRRVGSKPFSKEDLARVVSVAGHIGLAVANARLFARLNSTVERHRAVSAQLSSVIESLGSAVFALGQSGRVIQANKEALRLVHARKSLVGTRFEDIATKLPHELGAAAAHCVARAANGRKRRETVSTTGRHFVVSARPVSGGGVSLVIEETTDEIERERETARVRRLAEIGQMTAAIAHEIRNPLTSIRGAAQILQSESRVIGARAWGKVIETEALALNSLCDQFLDFARPNRVYLADVDPASLIDELIESYRAEFTAAGVRVLTTLDKKLPTIHADRHKLAQALRNLIRNAIDAMPRGGEITVSASAKNHKLQITIADTGKGISKESMSKLFTPFFTTKPSGTGLGLCNVLRTVEGHGGEVHVDSSGKGSSFTVVLPFNAMEEAA